jgi:hypothetical protein
VIAVSIGHRGYDPVIAMSLRAKKQIRNPGHYFTNAESAHRCLPQLTMCGRLSVNMDWDKSKEKYWSFQDLPHR